MPKTSKYVQGLMGETLDPYNVDHAVRMQAFYMAKIHQSGLTGHLWTDYQEYNGGRGALRSEMSRAGKPDPVAMRAACQRKKIKMSWGVLDMCDVNYDYSKNIYRYGQSYGPGPDGVPFW
jgi:hypothetical protein